MTLADLVLQWEQAQEVLSAQIAYLEDDHMMYPANGDPKKFTQEWLAKLRSHRDQYVEMATTLKEMISAARS